MRLIVLWLAACGGPPEDPARCGDAECRSAWVDQRWEGDAEGGASVLVGVDDPVERIALLTAMLDAHPEAGATLCAEMTTEDALGLCNRRRGRGHLWQTPPRLDPDRPRAAPGPAVSPLRTAETLPSLLSTVTAEAVSCDGGDEKACRLKLGTERAAAGDARGAAASCAGIEQSRWRSECTFRAAEALCDHDPTAYGDAVELCLLSGEFAPNCQGHLLRSLAQGAPPAETHQPEDWAAALDAASRVAETWSARDPDRVAEMSSRYWSEALLVAYSRAGTVTGDPLDVVPTEAVPHVRAAAAKRFALLNRAESWDLDGWTARLGDALGRRTDEPLSSVRSAGSDSSGEKPRGSLDWWPTDEPGDESIPAVVYLATSRRALSEDPLIDLRICMLEALARLPRKGNLLRQAMDDADPVIQWTARRLDQANRAAATTEDGTARPTAPGSRR